MPLVGSKNWPLVTVQDPKHAWKIAANQLLSNAHLSSFGVFYVTMPQHALFLQQKSSSLYHEGVFNCDNQDNGQSYWTFNDDTLAITLSKPECNSLSIYLFVMVELCDAWLNRTTNHQDCILSAFTSQLFLQQWNQYLQEQQSASPGLMSTEHTRISHQSHKILEQITKGLLALITSHCKYYSDFPLIPCPWNHGIKAWEHIFRWMCVILPNFTLLDAHEMSNVVPFSVNPGLGPHGTNSCELGTYWFLSLILWHNYTETARNVQKTYSSESWSNETEIKYTSNGEKGDLIYQAAGMTSSHCTIVDTLEENTEDKIEALYLSLSWTSIKNLLNKVCEFFQEFL